MYPYEICFYHDDNDGRMCASILKYQTKNAPIVYVPVNFGFEDDVIKKHITDMPNIYIGKIYIFDYTFTSNNMELLYKCVDKDDDRLIWCDHHKTAYDNNKILWNSKIEGLRNVEFAGCELVWQYYFKDKKDKNIPRIVQLIADRDMWRFKLKDTNALYESLKDLDDQIDIFYKMLCYIPNTTEYINSLIEDGFVLLQAKENRIKRNFKTGTDIIIRIKDIEYNVRIINTSEDISELGQFCYDIGYDIAFLWRYKNNQVLVSLRSKDKIDVAEIAKMFDTNGGGHKNAAGFETNLLLINDLLQKKYKVL